MASLRARPPALFDSLLPKNRGLSPCGRRSTVSCAGTPRSDGARDWSLLWGLAAREDGRVLGAPGTWSFPMRLRRSATRRARGRAHAPRRRASSTASRFSARPPVSSSRRRARPSCPPTAARRPADGARRTDTLLIGALLSLFVGMTMWCRRPIRCAEVSPGQSWADRRPRHDEGAGAGADGLSARRPRRLGDGPELGSMTVYDEITRCAPWTSTRCASSSLPRVVAANDCAPGARSSTRLIGVWAAGPPWSPPTRPDHHPGQHLLRAHARVGHFTDFVVGLVKACLRHGRLDPALHLRAAHARRTEGIAASTTAAWCGASS